MHDLRSTRQTSTSILKAAVVFVAAALGGCAYSGITSTPDGTVVLARNSLLGANRKIFVCHVAGNDLKCTESAASP
ncbi:MAG TPA: hypothetical protein VHJ20_10165 [Polyangia bacterium]|nr:hypothetical protein [Polyangia bacterium]